MKFRPRQAPWVRLVLSLGLASSSLIFLSITTHSHGSLGALLEPFRGLWNAPLLNKRGQQQFNMAGLKGPVYVAWDAAHVPHIFAQNPQDAFFVQGYVTASERLFQMDIQARLAGGELSEIMGDKTLSLDQFFVQIGMREAARRSLKMAEQDAEVYSAFVAYTAGVNAYIESITPQTMPMEYRLLGVQPKAWTVERSIQTVKMMAFRLAGRSYDLFLHKHLTKLSWDDLKELFLMPALEMDGLDTVYGSFKGNSMQLHEPKFMAVLQQVPEFLRPFATNGSNNWAVTGSKSVSGFSILANDTHLNYSLPAIWYEAQLSFDKSNMGAYGATIPGLPGVVIGFNNSISWGVTNGTSDVLDWYQIRWKNQEQTEYLFEGQALSLEVQAEEIKVRGRPPVKMNVKWTRFGPIAYSEKDYALAIRWSAHEPSNEAKTFVEFMKAKSHDECVEALRYFKTPLQNFICVDAQKISITHAGYLPKRPRAEGMLPLNGESRESDWQGEIPFQQLPRAIPTSDRDFVRSANQPVVDRHYPYYLGWDYDDPYRARRIATLLEEKSKFTPEAMIAIQNDTLNLQARGILPLMLASVKIQTLKQDELAAVELLKRWDFFESSESVASSIFQEWYNLFEEELWSPFLGPRKGSLYPKKLTTENFLRKSIDGGDEKSKNWLKLPSGEIRVLSELLTKTFKQSLANLERQYGKMGVSWQRGFTAKTKISHIARIPGLGEELDNTGGGRYTVNANRVDHGPAWKMVVHMKSPVEAWVNYPGGPSGNPIDPDYNKYVAAWAKGEMRPVHYWNIDEVERSENHWFFSQQGAVP